MSEMDNCRPKGRWPPLFPEKTVGPDNPDLDKPTIDKSRLEILRYLSHENIRELADVGLDEGNKRVTLHSGELHKDGT
jgi:hypothetical protein